MSTSIHVVVRFRPLNDTEKKEGPEPCVEPRGANEIFVADATSGFGASSKGASAGGAGAGAGVLDLAQQRQFTFDEVFQPKTEQNDLFLRVGKPVVDNVFKGYNGTILAYGQTGSGKTHSMLGPEGGTVDVLSATSPHFPMRGVIPRLVEELYLRLAKLPEQEVTWKVTCSVFELYKEQVLDLLTEGPQQEYRIKEDIVGGRGVFVDNLFSKTCLSASELLEAVRIGVTRRKVGATKSNATSSRSHSLTTITLEQVNHVRDGTVTTSRLTLVDLAGSEKVGKTQADGERLKEAQMINLSLTFLGNVIYKLTDGKSGYIPYRDSKLTRILQDSFGGNSITTLLCHCSPAMYNREETLSTLRFAARAKQIRNKPVVNRELSHKELQVQLAQALDRIKLLEGKLAWATGTSAIVDGVQHSPRRQTSLEQIGRTSLSSTRDSALGATTGSNGGGGGDAEDLRPLVESLLKQLDDIKKDVFQREEDIELATRQVEFYKQRAAEAEGAKNDAVSRAKRDECIHERKLADLLAENKMLADQLAAAKKQVANAVTTPSASVNNRTGSATIASAKSAPGTPVDSMLLEGSAIKSRDVAGHGKKPAALRKMTGGDGAGLRSGSLSNGSTTATATGMSDSSLAMVSALSVPQTSEMVVMASPLFVPASSGSAVLVANPAPLPSLLADGGDVFATKAGHGGPAHNPKRSTNNSDMTKKAFASEVDGQPMAVGVLEPRVRETPSPGAMAAFPTPPITPPTGALAPHPLGATASPTLLALPPKPETADMGIMAVVGPTTLELERNIEDLNRNLKTLMARNQAMLVKEKEGQSHLERLGKALEVTKTERDDNQQELDALRTLLNTKEKENSVMKRILQELNINIEEYTAMLGNEKSLNQRLMQTQEQLEYADMAAMEILVKEEDLNDIERDLHIIASTEDKDIFDRKRTNCLEVLAQLKTLFEHLSQTLGSQKFNTGTLESRRLCLVSDSTGMLRRIEESRCILHEFGTFDGC